LNEAAFDNKKKKFFFEGFKLKIMNIILSESVCFFIKSSPPKILRFL
jgi:hypothetical protein